MLNPVQGAARELIDAAEVERLSTGNALILDTARTRPYYFDGRFLTAADLTRDQQYIRARQADLARAGGYGVVRGLGVSITQDGSGRRLTIGAGHGVTPAGETVILSSTRSFDLSDIATIQRLDASFGLSVRPSVPATRRSGVFVLALRPVEFSANPIASYPTSLTGQRSLHDGDIVEAAAVTLIPYNELGQAERLDSRRARVAREIFLEGNTGGLPQEALPIAMLALDRGVLQWLDVPLVRREVGTESTLQAALGVKPRATREAFLLQYTQHLAEVLKGRDASGNGRRFAASTYFRALPPAGPLPVAAIESNSNGYLQHFFPASVDVDLSFVPADEVAMLVEESLSLPPLDLTLSDEELDSTAIVVLLPVSRAKLRELKAALGTVTRTLKAAAPGLIAKRRPLEMLTLVGRPLLTTRFPTVEVSPSEAAWAKALTEAGAANNGLAWYLRRRNLAYRSDLAGVALELAGEDVASEARLNLRLTDLKLATTFSKLSKSSTASANAEATTLLAKPQFATSNLLLQSAVTELKDAAGNAENAALDQARVKSVSQRFASANLGEGIAKLRAVQPGIEDDAKLRGAIAASGKAVEIDAAAARLSGEELKLFAEKISIAAAQGSDAVKGVVQ